MFLEVSPGDYLTLTAAPDTPGDIQSVNSPGAACCLMGTTTSPRTDKMPGNACREVGLADDLAGPVHVSYLSPRVEGAKKCCPEHLATLPADRHVLSFLDHVTFYFMSFLTFMPTSPQTPGHEPYNNSLPRALPAPS